LSSKSLSGGLSTNINPRCVDRPESLPELFVELLESRDKREGECTVQKTPESRQREKLKG